MHQPIREQLEEYLSGMDEASRREFEDLLSQDDSGRREVEVMRRQAALLQVLRAEEPVEPAPGFYARVLDRIESERPVSVWEAFLEPVFARRLAYASIALLLALGSLTVSAVRQPELAATSPEVILGEPPVSPALGRDQQRDRTVVLVNLATYEVH